MYAQESFSELWLLVSLILIGAGLFISICRKATERFSRKTLLERSVDWGPERVERFSRFKEDYEGTLGNFDIVVRCVISCCWLLGRLPALVAASPDFTFNTALGISLALLVLEIFVLQVLVLELLSAIIGRLWPEAWLARFSRLIRFLHSCFGPARWLLEGILRPLARVSGRSSHRDSADILEEELRSKAEEVEREGLLESEEMDMIESIISFGDVEVSEVMTPRTEMTCLDLDEPLSENLEKAIECALSRIPVYRESKDNVVGILYVKDLLRSLYSKEDISLESLIRSPYRVSGGKKIDDLLQEFKQHRLHIAIVMDEHGGTEGLVTIEDVIEEIVGEISDEYEQEEELSSIQLLSDGLVSVDAAVHIDDLNEELSLGIPENENYDTIGGLLFSSMGRIPKVGDTFALEGVHFEVTSADGRRVHRLQLRVPEKGGREDDGNGEV